MIRFWKIFKNWNLKKFSILTFWGLNIQLSYTVKIFAKIFKCEVVNPVKRGVTRANKYSGFPVSFIPFLQMSVCYLNCTSKRFSKLLNIFKPGIWKPLMFSSIPLLAALLEVAMFEREPDDRTSLNISLCPNQRIDRVQCSGGSASVTCMFILKLL